MKERHLPLLTPFHCVGQTKYRSCRWVIRLRGFHFSYGIHFSFFSRSCLGRQRMKGEGREKTTCSKELWFGIKPRLLRFVCCLFVPGVRSLTRESPVSPESFFFFVNCSLYILTVNYRKHVVFFLFFLQEKGLPKWVNVMILFGQRYKGTNSLISRAWWLKLCHLFH